MFNIFLLGGFEKLSGAYLLPPNKPKKKKETDEEVNELAKQAEICARLAFNEQKEQMIRRLNSNNFGGGWRPY